MKILLIQPNSTEIMVGFTSMIRPEPLALELIAATVPEHEVKILDLRVDPTLNATLASFRPDLVGITGYTANAPRMLQICHEVKLFEPSIITVLGGYHATLCPQDFDSEFVDVIVAGEGEITFRELVRALVEKQDLDSIDGLIYRRGGQQISTRPRDLVRNLNNLPLPARHLTDHYRSRYHFQLWEDPYLVETARGCPYRCTFCAVWIFHRGKCRSKSPESVLNDLKTAASPITCFVDDNFLDNLRRVDRLYQLIKSEGIKRKYWMQVRADSIVKRPDIIKKWAEIGLDSVLVGFESFKEAELIAFHKRSSISINEEAMRILLDNGVDMWGSFVVNPQWSKRDFDTMIDYVHKMNISFPLFTVLTPIPGTTFFQEKSSQLTTHNYEIFDFLHSVLPTKLPIKEFYSNMARLYASTTIGLSELKKRIKSGRIPVSALARIREVLRDVTNSQAYLASVRAV